MSAVANGPHQGLPFDLAGEAPHAAQAAMIMLHGRGGTTQDILGLRWHFDLPGWAYLAPQAADHSWYPHSFLAPIPDNEPGISSGIAAVGDVLAELEAAGVPPERVVLLGFSQGACLALEYVARNARRYGGVAGLSGGLIGPDGTPRDYPGSLEGTPVFLGCSDVDAHIPEARVHHSAEVLDKLGGEVTTRIYPGLGHTINTEELNRVNDVMRAVTNA